jgi:hypothetical protein
MDFKNCYTLARHQIGAAHMDQSNRIDNISSVLWVERTYNEQAEEVKGVTKKSGHTVLIGPYSVSCTCQDRVRPCKHILALSKSIIDKHKPSEQ